MPKIGRSEWGGASNFEVYQKTAPKNLFMNGYFGHEFSRRGGKSGSAFALVDLVSLVPLFIIKIQGSSSRCLVGSQKMPPIGSSMPFQDFYNPAVGKWLMDSYRK